MFRNLSLGDVCYGTKEKPVKVVNQYILGETLGEGSYGKVREAIDTTTLRRVAIKIMKEQQLRKIKNGEESVQREIAIMKKLRHPHVIEMHEVMQDFSKGKLYIVLELASCGSLEQLTEKARTQDLPVSLIRKYFRQLIQGLEYLHGQGIVHRDIKPANLLLTSDGSLKISDFGVAELLELYKETDICTRSMGSPAFQPPQIANGSEKFSGYKLDIWATGITLYLLATGTFPFSGTTVFNLLENIAKGEFTIPDKVDPVLQSLIRGILRVEEDERFSIEEIKRHPWMLAEDEEDVRLEDFLNLNSSSKLFDNVARAMEDSSFNASFSYLDPEPDAEGGSAHERQNSGDSGSTSTVQIRAQSLWQRDWSTPASFGGGGGGSSSSLAQASSRPGLPDFNPPVHYSKGSRSSSLSSGHSTPRNLPDPRELPVQSQNPGMSSKQASASSFREGTLPRHGSTGSFSSTASKPSLSGRKRRCILL